MSKNSHPPYSEELKARMVELVRAGRTPAELAEEFEPSSESIRRWAKQAVLDDGRHHHGLTTKEKEELRALRKKVAAGDGARNFVKRLK